MQSELFKLGKSDFVKGVALAIIVSILGILQQMLTAHGFNFGAYNWSLILQIALTSAIGYVTKNYLSDSKGRILGKIG